MVTYTAKLRIPKPNFDQSPWHSDMLSAFDQVDSLVYNALVSANVHVWANATLYGVGIGAIDTSNGVIYVNTVQHTSAAGPTTFAQDRVAHPTYWTALVSGFTPKGQWIHDTNYAFYDIVYDTTQGIVALCTTAHTSNHVGTIRTDAVNWAFIFDATTIINAGVISFTPSGTIAAANIQAAIAELDSEMDARILADVAGWATFTTALANITQAQTDVTALYNRDAASDKNIIINGSMEISQEKSTNVTAINANAVFSVLDQWEIVRQGTMILNAQQVASPFPGTRYALKLTVTTAEAALAAGDCLIIQQKIEGNRWSKLGYGAATGLPVSIGFYVSAHRTGTYSGSIRNGASNRSYPFSFTINAADTAQWVTITNIPADITGTWPQDNTLGALLSISMACGTTFAGTANSWAGVQYMASTGTTNGVAAVTDVFTISNVVVIPGDKMADSTRAPWLMRSFDEELDLCLRYWQKSYDYGSIPGTVSAAGNNQIFASIGGGGTIATNASNVALKKRMRVAPTVTSYSNATGASGQVRDNNAAADVAAAIGTVGETTFYNNPSANVPAASINLTFQWTASARM